MNQQQRIERLELAVLHLSRAVNDLVGAVQAAKIEAQGGPRGLLDTLHGDSEGLVRQAYKHVEQAVNSISEPA